MIHGDYHTKNIVLAGDEVLVIDMDTLSVGHPIFDLMQMYNSYVGYSELDPAAVLAFQGYPAEIARRFWHDSLCAYLGADDAAAAAAEKKVRILSYADLIDWSIRYPDEDKAKNDAAFTYRRNALIDLLEETETLVF